MAAAFGNSDDDIISGINVTPLVDVVLVLLIIFLITAPVIYQSAIKVHLPSAKSGSAENQKSPFQFTLTKEGALTWDKEPISWETLTARLAKIKANRAEVSGSPADENGQTAQTDQTAQTAMISADRDTPHGTVVRLMDALRQAGLYRFALNVDGGTPNGS